MNAYKNGSLEAVSAKNWFANETAFRKFMSALCVSEQDHELWYGDKKVAQDMKKEQLESHMYCNLKYFDYSASPFGAYGRLFNPKTIQKMLNPVWPSFLHYVGKNAVDLQFEKCSFEAKSMELFAYALGENPIAPCKVRTLNLKKNAIGKEGAKLLAPALKLNMSLLFLDLSSCKIGVSGGKHIFEELSTNTRLESLNLYRNILDVDGARALGKCLEVNKTLKFVDIGHNRIRITGLKAIVSGILANEDCRLSQLGVRANFINDDGFSYLFSKLVLCDPAQKQRLTHIFLKSNFLTEYHKVALYKDIKEKKIQGLRRRLRER